MDSAVRAARAGKNDRREIFGWLAYDWANSAFQTTVLTVLAGPYLTALAQAAAGDNGPVLRAGSYVLVTAKSFFPYCIALSVFLQVFLLPVLGAIADYTQYKKRLMACFCYTGAAATCLMVTVSGGRLLFGGMLLILSNVCFGAANVLYNAYLNDITTEDRRDRVSSRGFAVGYLGGGLLLAANLVFVASAAALGVSKGLAVRLSLMSAGVWWGGFSAITFALLRTHAPARRMAPNRSYFSMGLTEVRDSIRELRRLPQTLRYLLAYMSFNDGIQTVIAIASVFLAQELFVAKGLPVSDSFLMGLILMVQFVAFFGSLVFERIAGRLGTKRAILASLVVWTFILVYAYAFLQTTAEAWAMGAAIAVVLGGSQALSRSLFSRMIPAGREASFFGLYEISERGTSWIGPLIFGLVVARTNSYRDAILSLIVLFAAGMIALISTDTDRAIHDAGNRRPAEASRTTA